MNEVKDRRALISNRWLWPLLTTAATFVVYWLTLAPDLTWANYGVDGGELITASFTLGVPHSPGYPTYTLLGKLFSFLPIGAIAFRYNLFSATLIAIAAAFVTAIAAEEPFKHSSLAALATGLVFAFAPLVWSQALIAEVYALNLALLSAFLWLLLGGRSSFVAGLLLGLSVTAHLTSLLMLPLALILTARRRWPMLAIGLAIGLFPLLIIPLLALGDSPLVWGQPTTLSGWWHLVNGAIYRANVLSLPYDRVAPRALNWGRSLLEQFTLLGLPLLLVSLSQNWRKKRLGPILGTAALYAAYAFTYDSSDAAVFFLPGLLLLSITLASGMAMLGSVALLLPVALLTLNFNSQDLSGEVAGPDVRRLATIALESAPPQAILLTPGDQSVSALWYFHYVERQRQDVIIIDSNLFAFSWYRRRLGRFYPELHQLERDDLAAFIDSNQQQRPVCFVSLPEPQPVICQAEGR